MTESEYRHLVITQRDRLHTYVAWSLGDREMAGDVSQEAFLRLWQHHREVHPAAGRAWLFRAANRLCVDRFRQKATRSEVSLADSADSLADAGTPVGDAGEMRQLVAAGLARLSARDRNVLVLREVVGMPNDEIAGVLQHKSDHVKVLVHRARQRLRRELMKVTSDREY